MFLKVLGVGTWARMEYARKQKPIALQKVLLPDLEVSRGLRLDSAGLCGDEIFMPIFGR